MDVELDARLGLVLINQEQFKDIRIKGNLNEGRYKGALTIDKVFNGSAHFKTLNIPLFELEPLALFQLQTQNINLSQGLRMFFPSIQKLFNGWLSLDVTGMSTYPGLPGFEQNLKAKGGFKLTQGSIYETDLLERVNSLIYSKSLNSTNHPIQANKKTNGINMEAAFRIEKRELNFDNSWIANSGHSGVLFEGSLGFDGIGNLKGTFYSVFDWIRFKNSSDEDKQKILRSSAKSSIGFTVVGDLRKPDLQELPP